MLQNKVISTFIFLYLFCIFSVCGQFYPEKKITEKKFDYKKIRVSASVGISSSWLYTTHKLFGYRDDYFNSFVSDNDVYKIDIAYKHNKWVCPELVFQIHRYEGEYIKYFGGKWIPPRNVYYNLGVGNRISIMNKWNGFSITIGHGVLFSIAPSEFRRESTYSRTHAPGIINDSTRVNGKTIKPMFNLIFYVDIAFNLWRITKHIDLVAGISYFQTIKNRREFHSYEETIQGTPVEEGHSIHYGSTYQLFAKIILKLNAEEKPNRFPYRKKKTSKSFIPQTFK